MKVALTGHRPQRLGMPDDELDDKWNERMDCEQSHIYVTDNTVRR